ncbi:putative membrane protein YdfJ with MMPL/SSD domain [Sporomusaceae bacterium BoRhaA]|uniref:hypothetical protein n=1 Tax=Pelorhabdus rhamnosifermentans TaxID=2772457 RepID=UPI001C0601D7|nr:hypothetical protein [Pelorhabdus rhamnosifermentans]MBU2701710.1 putative membrane protein YdfJ with MMPL/SSD domain [Pelorhabdus rhamnosifermentans]
MIPASLGRKITLRKVLLALIIILVLVGISFMMQAQKGVQNNASSAKALSHEEKQKNAEHMVAVTNNICGRFDEILKNYSDSLDDISYNNKPTESIYNDFKSLKKTSEVIQRDSESIQIIDPRYEDIKASLIQVEVNIQLSAQHMMEHLSDPKNNADWKAQNELVNAMQLNNSVKKRIATLTQEDSLKLSK